MNRYNAISHVDYEQWEKIQKAKYSQLRHVPHMVEPINNSQIEVRAFFSRLHRNYPGKLFTFKLIFGPGTAIEDEDIIWIMFDDDDL